MTFFLLYLLRRAVARDRQCDGKDSVHKKVEKKRARRGFNGAASLRLSTLSFCTSVCIHGD